MRFFSIFLCVLFLSLSLLSFSSFSSLSSSKGFSVPLKSFSSVPKYRNYERHAKRVGADPVPSFLKGNGHSHVPLFMTNSTRGSGSGSSESEPVGGNVWPVAIYWMFLQVGTPPQPFPVAIDTGSMTMDVIAQGCSSCISTPPNRVYNPTSSSTSSPVLCGGSQCTFSNSYQTCDLSNPNNVCTISGSWFQDQVTIGNAPSTAIQFGGITSQTSNFNQFQTIDAIVGLIQQGANDPTDVFLSLYEAGSFPENKFGMCLIMGSGSGSNGTINFGGIDTTLYTGELQYTPNLGGGQSYSMQLNSLTVFGQPVTSVATQAILDSGTNVLLLPDPGYSAVAQVFFSQCANGAKLVGTCDVPAAESIWNGTACFRLTEQQIAAYPTITLNIAGFDIKMPPSTYLTNAEPNPPSPSPSLYCNGIRNTGQGGLTIIGDTSMSNYYVVFDNQNNQIGWAPVNTQNCGNIQI